MYKPAFLSGLMLALLSVITGAFGAHYLKSILTPELLISFETGVRYQMYHALALILLGGFASQIPISQTRKVFWFLLGGVILFSGSIYLLCILKGTASIGLGGLGLLTPLGGLMMILGWGLWTLAIFKKTSQ